MKRTALVLMLWLVTVCAYAGRPTDIYYQQENKHFKVRSSQPMSADILKTLEKALAKAEKVLDIQASGYVCEVDIFKDKEELLWVYNEAFGKKETQPVDGFFASGSQVIYLAQDNLAYTVLKHEVAHALLWRVHSIEKKPLSMNEHEILAGYTLAAKWGGE